MQAIQQGKDGIYRWVYELNLYTNPTIFFLVSKIFLGIGLGLFFFIQVLVMIEDGFQLDQLLDSIVMLAAGFVGILVLVAVGYLVYAFIMGGKYCVLFEMDERGVKHTQLPHQVKKAKVIGMLAVMTGAAAGNLTAMGSGLLAASHSSTYSEFSKVKSLEILRKRNAIKLNEPMNYNQIYVDDDNFDFVLKFIQTRVG
ncbi:MAG: hypothetical protein K6F01_07240 [Selenomonas sp.]|uniref:hypothetical protein n=1 Tax=Selenomonas sp. TaxID=2053611 RepID=UPI0025F9CAAD|nr:hypothetical protein [Selenomonas sp.]MCR5439207.1 hypothetical protein [Selenomonas sp.]